MVGPESGSSRIVSRLEGPLIASVRPPGSKSLTNRFLILAALCRGEGVLRHPLRAEDTDRLLAAIETLGGIVRPEGHVLRLDGGDGRFPGGGSIDLGAGGTPTRFMIAAAALARLPVEIDGAARMRARPIDEGVELVRQLGGRVEYLAVERRLPVRVEPTEFLEGGDVAVGSTASSQFVSAVLLVAPFTRRGVVIRFTEPPTSETYLDLTLFALEEVGVHTVVERSKDGGLLRIEIPSQTVRSFDVEIEADASSAIYPAMLAAGRPGSRLEISGLGRRSRQPDLAALLALDSFGAIVEATDGHVVISGPEHLDGVTLDCSSFPDAAVGLVALASIARSPSHFTGLETLRVKESDRISALAIELRKIGCEVSEDRGAIKVAPPPGDRQTPASPIRIGTWDDHRLAMSFGIIGSLTGGLEIEDPGCVAKSHPGFWAELERLKA
ncbi:MAG: 3-phosphoshikimate 1-carboxyvinyltransferase [Planctomycetota bacterium]|nr:3-phosphoshikimate 1-carboxyvinyltransferase [Planctomycetota bacterium]MDA1025901.1 3-phosphoshikimate 1-carboxyvinyltransferase [Planctomycetota bacterium]